MDMPSSSIDVVIEKCVMDCFACSTKPDAGSASISLMLQESSRVLVSGGVYVCVSLHDSLSVQARIKKHNKEGALWSSVEVVTDTVQQPKVKATRKEKDNSSDDTESDEGDAQEGKQLGNGGGFALLICKAT